MNDAKKNANGLSSRRIWKFLRGAFAIPISGGESVRSMCDSPTNCLSSRAISDNEMNSTYKLPRVSHLAFAISVRRSQVGYEFASSLACSLPQ
jgi:hypothetical protein